MNFCSLRSLLARTLSLSLASYIERSEGFNISSGRSGGVAGEFDGTVGLAIGKRLCFRRGACRTFSGGLTFVATAVSKKELASDTPIIHPLRNFE